MVRDERLRQSLHRHLANFDALDAHAPDSKHAAVALAVVDEGDGADLVGIDQPRSWSGAAALLLTRRSQRLRNHPGQWALPGGRLDPGETPEQTALRGMHEEVGLEIGEDAVLGRLDDFATRSGFVMTPVVVWAGRAETLELSPDEVASAHRIPLSEFLRDDAPIFDRTEDPERPVLRMPVGDDSIAAPTAAILYQFAEVCLRGRSTRVAHFEQPEFAWR